MASSLTMVYDIIARDRASSVFARTGTAAESSAAKIGALGKAIGVFAAIDIGYHAVKSAAEFQRATNVYVTAAGETTGGLKQVRQGILDVASSTGQSVKGLTEAGYVVEKAGYRGADVAKILRAASQGAAEENANLGTVTNALTSIMASYHLNASDSVSVTNELKTAAGESKVSMEQFAGSLSTVLPLASANHVAFADVAGALATLTQHGTSADEATQELAFTIRGLAAPNQVANKEFAQLTGTTQRLQDVLAQKGLTGTLSYLSDLVISKMGPSGKVLLSTFNNSKIAAEDAKTEFAALGPEAQKLAKSFEDGSVGVGDYRKAAKGLGGEQGALALQFLTTYTNAHGFQDLIKQGGPAAQTYTEAIKKLTGGANGLNTTLQITGENLAGTEERTKKIADAAKIAGTDVSGWASTQALLSTKMAIFRQNVDVLGIKIGTALIPAVTGVVSGLSGAATWIQKNSDVIGPLAKVLGIAGVAYIGVATAMSLYEKAAIRVTIIQGAMNDLWLKGGGSLGGFGKMIGGQLLTLGAYAGIAAIVVGTIRHVGDSSKYAADQVAQFTKNIDPGNLDTYSTAIDGMTRKLDQTKTVGSALRTVFNTLTGGLTGPTASEVGKAQDALLTGIQNTKAGAINAKESIFELGQQYHLSDAQVVSLAHGMGIDLSGGIQQSIDKFRSLISTQSQWMQIAADQKTTIIGFNDSLRHLGDNLAANRKDWSDNTDAGKQNWETLQTATGWYSRYAQSLQAAGPLTQAQTDKLNGMYDQLLNTITGLIGNRDQAKNLLDQLNLLPPDKSVPVSLPGVVTAITDVNTLADALRGIPDTKDILVRIHQDIQQAGPAAPFATGSAGIQGPADPFAVLNGLQPHADGGFITGPGGPRDDRIPALLSNGEFVVRASRTKAFRPLLDAINGTSGGSVGHFATGGPVVAGKDQTVADFKLTAAKPQPKVFDELFKAPVESQKRNQAAIDKAAKTAFVDPQAAALDKSAKAAHAFADSMPKDFVKTVDSHRDDILGSYTSSAYQPWQDTTGKMNDLADKTGKSVPAKIVSGLNNAVGAVKAASDQLLALVQKPIDLLHGKTVQIVANTAITGVVTAATGGHIRGPGTETSDSIPAMLSDGEFVVNAAATKKHLPLLKHINKARGYADGGLVTPEYSLTGAGGAKETAAFDRLIALADKKLSAEAQKRVDAAAIAFMSGLGAGGEPINWNGGPDTIGLIEALARGLPFGNQMQVTSTFRPGGGTSYHGRHEAVDFSNGFGNTPQMLAFDRAWAAKYGGSLAELIYTAPGSEFIKDGKLVAPGFYSGVLDEHRNHVHVAISPASIARGHVTFDAFKNSGGGLLAGSAKAEAQQILARHGWGNQFPALDNIISRESGWDPTIHNGGGHGYVPGLAYGIPQALPGSKMASAGPDWLTNPATQLRWMIDTYIPQTYGDPNGAWRFWQGHHAYRQGGYPPLGRPFWVGENGAELMERTPGGGLLVHSAEKSQKMTGSSTLMHVENMHVGSDVDFQLELARAQFLRETSGYLG